MSKKVESIKNMVFYSQQKPEKLATLIAGLVTDVATSITISGKSSIQIPSSGTANKETYSAKVLSQFGDEMSDSVTLELNTSVTGVSVSGNEVSVDNTATDTSFVLKATSGTVTQLMTVELIPKSEE